MFGMTTQTQFVNSNKVATLLTEEDFFSFVDNINYILPAVVKKEESSKKK